MSVKMNLDRRLKAIRQKGFAQRSSVALLADILTMTV